MNKRLKELAEQAKEYARGFNYQHEVFEKKFAELIVRECACIADDMKSLETANAIKEHFGVSV